MSPQPTDPTDPIGAFAELARITPGETNVDGVLPRVTDLAQRSLRGAAEVSITLVRQGVAHTAAPTGPMAAQLDEWQYHDADGPCLAAAATKVTISLPDLAADRRWPRWSRRAVAAGAGSTLSVGLPILDDVNGALNIYATTPNAFDEETIALAGTFAGYAAVALANAHLYDTTATLAQHMQAAMGSRAVIEQAKGIIMGDRRCTPDEAFEILNRISQDSNRKLRDVAAALVAEAQRRPR